MVSDPTDASKRNSLRGAADAEAMGTGAPGRTHRRSASDTGAEDRPQVTVVAMGSDDTAAISPLRPMRRPPALDELGGEDAPGDACARGFSSDNSKRALWRDAGAPTVAGPGGGELPGPDFESRPRVQSDSDRMRPRRLVGTMHALEEEMVQRGRAGSVDKARSPRTSRASGGFNAGAAAVTRSPRGYRVRGTEIARVSADTGLAPGRKSAGVLLPGEWIRGTSFGHESPGPGGPGPLPSPQQAAAAATPGGLSGGAARSPLKAGRSEEPSSVGAAGRRGPGGGAALRRTRTAAGGALTRRESMPNMNAPFAVVSRDDTAELSFAFNWREALRAALAVGVCPLVPLAAWLGAWRGPRRTALRVASPAECLASAAFIVGLVVCLALPDAAIEACELGHACCVHVIFVAVVTLRCGLSSSSRVESGGDGMLMRQLVDAERRSGTDLGPLKFLFPVERYDSVRHVLRASGACDACPTLRPDPEGNVPARLVVACILLNTQRAEGADPASGQVPLSRAMRAARLALCVTVALLPTIVRAGQGGPPLGGGSAGAAVTTLFFSASVAVHLNKSYAEKIIRLSIDYFRRRGLVLQQFSRLLAGTWVLDDPAGAAGARPPVTVAAHRPSVGPASAIAPTLLSAASTHTGLQARGKLRSWVCGTL